MILVNSTLIYTCKYKHLNYTKFISKNSSVKHILGMEARARFFQKITKSGSKMAKQATEKGQNYTKTYKNREIFYHFRKGTLISHAFNYRFHKKPKMYPASYKMQQFHIKHPLFLSFY